MNLPILADPQTRFSCGGCGDCCNQPYRVMIEPDKADAIRKHTWDAYPQLAGKPLFAGAADAATGLLDVTKGEGHRCVFLTNDNLCLIHKELGPAAKPSMCLHFPYLPSATWSENRVSASYGCPSIQRGEGRILSEQMDDIRASMPLIAARVQDRSPVKLVDDVTMSPDAFDALVDQLLALFDDAHIADVWSRFAAALTMVGNAAQKNDAPPPTASEWPVIRAMPNPATAPAPSRVLFAATLFPDTAPADAAAKMGFFQRITMIPRLMNLSKLSGGYASRLLGWNVSIDAVLRHRVAPHLDERSTGLLLRYFRARLWQRLLIGTRLSVVGGIHQHIQDFNAIIFYARAIAMHENADTIGFEHVRRGLSLVEFHMANQPRLYHQALRGWLTGMLDSIPLAAASLRLMSLAPADTDVPASLR